jgi:rhodanese-related sulfurtransferase
VRAAKEAVMVASITSSQLYHRLGQETVPLVVDVRREAAYSLSGQMLPGACWRSPEAVRDWIVEIPRDRIVVVYCVHGHKVSQGVAAVLRQARLDVAYLEGGIEGWIAMNLPVAMKPAGSER